MEQSLWKHRAENCKAVAHVRSNAWQQLCKAGVRHNSHLAFMQQWTQGNNWGHGMAGGHACVYSSEVVEAGIISQNTNPDKSMPMA
jgi:hypothetical protein